MQDRRLEQAAGAALGPADSDDPPHTWQTAQRLAGLGFDWHTIMHMIASVVPADIYMVMTEDRRFDLADYSRRLDELPSDWPPPGPSSAP